MTFETFPYANMQDLNIDWILKKLKELLERVEALENVDIHEEIVTIINEMIESGELEQLFDELLESIRAQIRALETLTASHTLSINALNSSQAEQDELISGLLSRMREAETQIESLWAAIQILDPTGQAGDIAQRVVALEQAVAALQQTVATHTTQIAALEARIAALEGSAYESRDISAVYTPAEIQSHLAAQDGVIKIGNYWTVTYTDPETLESSTAQLVVAEIQGSHAWLVVRSTKHHAYNSSVFDGAAGYGASDIRTYADLLGEALYTAMSLSPIYQTYPVYQQSIITIGGVTQLLPAAIQSQSHCCILMSSMAYLGSYVFGAKQFGAIAHKLALYDYEAVPHGYLLYDYIVDERDNIEATGALRCCRTVSQRLAVPYAVSVGTTLQPDITTEAQPVEFMMLI